MINTPLSRSTITNANSELVSGAVLLFNVIHKAAARVVELVSGAGTSPIVISTIVDQ